MPRYDFKCRACNEMHEAIVPVTMQQKICPVCLLFAAERQLSAPARIFIK